jgi:hypothetical protein
LQGTHSVSRLGAARVRELHQRTYDARHALGLLEDLASTLLQFRGIGTVREVLRNAGDAGDRVADFVRHARGQAADRCQPLRVQQLVLHALVFADVFDQHLPLAAVLGAWRRCAE